MAAHVCAHLRPLEDYLVKAGGTITAKGKLWSQNCRYWIYFDAVLDCTGLKSRLGLGSTVTMHENDDPRSGAEKGLECTAHHDAIVGLHPAFAKGAKRMK